MNGPKGEGLITYRLDFLFPFHRSLLHNTHDDTHIQHELERVRRLIMIREGTLINAIQSRSRAKVASGIFLSRFFFFHVAIMTRVSTRASRRYAEIRRSIRTIDVGARWFADQRTRNCARDVEIKKICVDKQSKHDVTMIRLFVRPRNCLSGSNATHLAWKIPPVVPGKIILPRITSWSA